MVLWVKHEWLTQLREVEAVRVVLYHDRPRVVERPATVVFGDRLQQPLFLLPCPLRLLLSSLQFLLVLWSDIILNQQR